MWTYRIPEVFSTTTSPGNSLILKKRIYTIISKTLDHSQALRSSLGTFSYSTIVHFGRIKHSNDTKNPGGVDSAADTSASTNAGRNHTDPNGNPEHLESFRHQKSASKQHRDIIASPANAVGNYTAVSPSAELNRTTPVKISKLSQNLTTHYAPQTGHVGNSSTGKFIITNNGKEAVDGSKPESQVSNTKRPSLEELINDPKFYSKQKIINKYDNSQRHKQISTNSTKRSGGQYEHAKQTRVTVGAIPAGRVSVGQGDDDRPHFFGHTKWSFESNQQHGKAENARHAVTSVKGAY